MYEATGRVLSNLNGMTVIPLVARFTLCQIIENNFHIDGHFILSRGDFLLLPPA